LLNCSHFVDFFLQVSQKYNPEELVQMLNHLFSLYDLDCAGLGCEKVSNLIYFIFRTPKPVAFQGLTTDVRFLQLLPEKICTIGDSYLAVAGLPDPCEHYAAKALELAVRMILHSTAFLEESLPRHNSTGISKVVIPGIRVGVASGKALGAIVGGKLRFRKFQISVQRLGMVTFLILRIMSKKKKNNSRLRHFKRGNPHCQKAGSGLSSINGQRLPQDHGARHA
jgi:hypothetical protein